MAGGQVVAFAHGVMLVRASQQRVLGLLKCGMNSKVFSLSL